MTNIDYRPEIVDTAAFIAVNILYSKSDFFKINVTDTIESARKYFGREELTEETYYRMYREWCADKSRHDNCYNSDLRKVTLALSFSCISVMIHCSPFTVSKKNAAEAVYIRMNLSDMVEFNTYYRYYLESDINKNA